MSPCSSDSLVGMTLAVLFQYSMALPTPLPGTISMPTSRMAISAPDKAPQSMSSFMLPKWPMRNTFSSWRGNG